MTEKLLSESCQYIYGIVFKQVISFLRCLSVVAQELLSQWMEEKVNLTGYDDSETDVQYTDDAWERHEVQSDVKREWDKLLSNNLEEYGLHHSSADTPGEYYGN